MLKKRPRQYFYLTAALRFAGCPSRSVLKVSREPFWQLANKKEFELTGLLISYNDEVQNIFISGKHRGELGTSPMFVEHLINAATTRIDQNRV